jgi:DNA-directed RNA polymerase specialized sigma24 family protein
MMMTAMDAEVGVDGKLVEGHREHYRSLVRLASPLVDDVSTCEEIVQDAFVAVFRSPGRVREPDRRVLRFYVGSSEAEIATTLGIAPGTVKTHMRRGLAALAQLVEDRR